MDSITDLTPRQIQILKAVIDEYIASAEAVGSQTLEKSIIWVFLPQPFEMKW